MNKKTSTSLLNEYLQARKLPLTTYSFEKIPGAEVRFKCKAEVLGHAAVGTGNSKKSAKLESSRILLASLQQKPLVLPKLSKASVQKSCSNHSSAQQSSSTESQNTDIKTAVSHNYIGELNEWAAKHKEAFPVYTFLPTTTGGEFVVSCTFMKYRAFGKGTRKQDAKQESARKILRVYLQTPCTVKRNVGCGPTYQAKVPREAIVVNDAVQNSLKHVVTNMKTLSLHQKTQASVNKNAKIKRIHITIDLPN